MSIVETVKTSSYYSATVNDLQTKVESLTTTNALMKEDLSITRTCVDKIQVMSAWRLSDLSNFVYSNYSGWEQETERWTGETEAGGEEVWARKLRVRNSDCGGTDQTVLCSGK